MQAVLNVALPVFGIILCGFLAGRAKLLGAASSEALNTFVYWFALPPLIFIGMAQTPVDRILNGPFILAVSLGILGTGVVVVLGSRYLFHNTGPANGLHAMAALFSNTGYMGIPLFIAAFGEDRVLPAVTATVLNMFFYGTMTAWVAATKEDDDRKSGAAVAAQIAGAPPASASARRWRACAVSSAPRPRPARCSHSGCSWSASASPPVSPRSAGSRSSSLSRSPR
mgnify:CR=1 FL=1